MLGELVEIKSGVGSVIISRYGGEEKLLTVKELTTWPGTNKVAGMRSFPMETIEGEETHLEALQRAVQEEVIVDHPLDFSNGAFLGRFELRQGVVLHAYLITLDILPKLSPGTFVNEVGDPEWTPIHAIMTNQNSYSYRPGVLDTIQSYQQYIQNPTEYVPRLVRHNQIKGNISVVRYE